MKTYRDLSDLANESDFIASNDAIQDPFGIRSSNEHLSLKARRGERSAALWAQEHPNLYDASLVAGAIPFAVASAPAIVPATDAVAASSIGSAVTAGLTNPYVDAALLSAGYADALNSAMRGEFGYTNALELVPLGRLARPMFNKAALAIENYRYPLGRPQVPNEYLNITPKVRTRVGDVEVDNPQLAYRQGDKGILDDFFSSGEVRTPEGSYAPKRTVTTKSGLTFDFGGKTFENPMFAQGRLWYGLPKQESAGLLVTSEPLAVANKSSRMVRNEINGTFDLRYTDVGQAGRRVQLEEGQLSPFNTAAYTWEPGYGYKRVLAEETPTAEWPIGRTASQIIAENAASEMPNIVRTV